MLLGHRPGPYPFVDLGSLHPPAQCVRRDTELLPDPHADPTPARGLTTRIEHKPNRTPSKFIRISAL